MVRFAVSLCALVLVFGCSRRPAPPVTPTPVSAPVPAPAPDSARPTNAPPAERRAAVARPDSAVSRPTPAADSALLDVEDADERRLAADSAADEAVLQELAETRADSGADDADPAEPGGAKALANATTWDIDVETFNTHDRVQYYLNFYQGKARERMEIWLNRMARYETMIRERLQKEGLPEDLVYLALIESGFSNTATSRAKAVGMWQFMKGTGKHYGLRIDSWVDERRDPYRATDAAARHLRDLTDRFGSVYLAAAAYNAGAGRVSRGLVRLPEDEDADSLNSDATFFRLYDTQLLKRETKDYVPKLIAAARIAKEPARYGLRVMSAMEPARYDSVIVSDMTGLDVIARLAGTTVATVREMNPQYLRLATPPGARSVVRLPAGKGPATQLAYAELPPHRRVSFVEHTVRRGETLSGIARRYGVSTAMITDANPKLRRRKVRAGQLVVIPTGGVRSTVVARRMAEPVAPAGTNTSGWHRVKRGETLSEIADDYGVKQRDLRAWNSLGKSSRIRAGQRLRVAPLAVASKATKKIATAKKAVKTARKKTHVVRRGETLTGLAQRYGVSVRALREANGMSARSSLKAGATIKIPG